MIRLAEPAFGEQAAAAVAGVLASGQLVHGEQCVRWESELSEYLGGSQVALCSSGTAALHLALLASGIGPGHAVLVPDFTFPATANVVELVGARPVLVDVERGTYVCSPAAYRAALAAWTGPERPAAIMPVHEFGCPADMAGIMALAGEFKLTVIEDAACAIGTRCAGRMAGTLGHLGCFSFHPRKTLTTGEGGAVVTRDAELDTRVRLLRSHGMQPGPAGLSFLAAGLNYRMTNFQAALGRTQMAALPGWIERRRELALVYDRALAHLPVQRPVQAEGHSWQTYMVVLPESARRAAMIAALRERGIESNLGAQGLHELDYYRAKYPDMCASLSGGVAEMLYRRGLALPLHPRLSEADVRCIAQAVSECL